MAAYTPLMIKATVLNKEVGCLKAEVKVGRRRIVEIFLYPLFRYFNEGLSVT